MLRPNGYGIWVDPDSPTKERDTVSCRHCGGSVFVEPFQDPKDMGGGCYVCQGFLCSACYKKRSNGGPCDPWEEQMRRSEERYASRRSLGIME